MCTVRCARDRRAELCLCIYMGSWTLNEGVRAVVHVCVCVCTTNGAGVLGAGCVGVHVCICVFSVLVHVRAALCVCWVHDNCACVCARPGVHMLPSEGTCICRGDGLCVFILCSGFFMFCAMATCIFAVCVAAACVWVYVPMVLGGG